MLCPRCHRRYQDDHHFCPHDGERLVDAIDIKRIRSQPTEHAGQIIGDRYQIRGFIGRGAMAQVYLAQDRTTRSAVAVKVMESKHLKQARARARFILEAKAAAKIHHPSIIEVLDVGLEESGAPYIVMEFLFGESLGEYLRRERMMPPALGLPFVTQIAGGLAAAHRAGIIHRDVKPDNVFLLGEKGSPYTIKLLDFGFAKLAEHSGMTQTGMTVGTVQYMAPEQAVSDPSDARTDVYGLGMMMYRMFAGNLPFKGQDEAEMLAHQLLTQPAPPGLGGGRAGAALEAVILKAIRKNPENRYQSMDAMLADLRRLSPESERRGAGNAIIDASLAAWQPMPQPDIYKTTSPFAITASRFLHTKLGKTPPA